MIKPKTNREAYTDVLVWLKPGRGAQSELARQLGVTKQLVSRWDEIPLKYVIPLAEILHKNEADIVPELAQEVAEALEEKDWRILFPTLIRIFTKDASPCPKKRKSKRRSQA